MKLTKKTVEALEVTGQRYEARDDDIKGFVVRVGTAGNKSFYFVYRAGKGRKAQLKRLHIGNFPTLTVEQARAIARDKAAQVALGSDPSLEVQQTKSAPTIREALTMFFEEHGTKIKEKTLYDYRRNVELNIFPAIGKIKIDVIDFRQIASLHLAMRETPYKANRCIALLSKFFNWCEKNGLRACGSNPVRGIEKYPEYKRQAFMKHEELTALGNSLALLESGSQQDEKGRPLTIDPTISAAIKVLLFTGARCMEILTLKWEYIDWQKGIANLPDSKTGAKTIHLPTVALAILNSLPRINEYCFPGRFGKGHITNIKDSWARLLKLSGLTGWRIHDLRHAYASYAVSSGKSLPIIGAILGHTQAATTSRYAHLADNPIAVAAEETANQLLQDFSNGKIITFDKAVG